MWRLRPKTLENQLDTGKDKGTQTPAGQYVARIMGADINAGEANQEDGDDQQGSDTSLQPTGPVQLPNDQN